MQAVVVARTGSRSAVRGDGESLTDTYANDVAAGGRRGVGDREDLRPCVEAGRFGIG